MLRKNDSHSLARTSEASHMLMKLLGRVTLLRDRVAIPQKPNHQNPRFEHLTSNSQKILVAKAVRASPFEA